MRNLRLLKFLKHLKGRKYTLIQRSNCETNREKQAFFNELRQEAPHLEKWLFYIEERGRSTRPFHSLYEKDRNELKKLIFLVERALKGLPKNGQFERLPIFSQRITKNPHAFDLDTELGRAFLHALQLALHEKGEWRL